MEIKKTEVFTPIEIKLLEPIDRNQMFAILKLAEAQIKCHESYSKTSHYYGCSFDALKEQIGFLLGGI